MQHSGFFNALNVNGIYDRTYNANDYSNNLAVIISNGVLRSEADDLKVTANGMIATVAVGRAWIKGHYYYNDAAYSFGAITAPTGGTRYDRIVLRFDNTLAKREISLVYLTGTAASTPVKPAITRTDSVYDLVLADIYIGTNATSVTVTDTRADNSVCGWVYSVTGDYSFFASLDNSFNTWFSQTRNTLASVTIFKSYTWDNSLNSATNTVQFNIPQYDATGVNVLQVYVNGSLRSTPTHYSVSGNIITFTNTLTAGTLVSVRVYKSVDGTGIDSIVDDVTELQNTVASLEGVARFNYDCVNNNDNISLSQIAQAIYSGSYTAANVTQAAANFLEKLGGNTYLAGLATDAQITINVVGKCGVSQPYTGSGTALSRNKYFSLGVDAVGEKKVVFDFSKCERILIYCATNTENIIFYGTDLDVRNIKVTARCNAASCAIEMIAGRYNTGRINFENCDLKVITTGKAVISENGTFTNCNIYCSSSDNHALCFCPTTASLIRVIGGTHRAYVAGQNGVSAIFYTYGTETDAVIMARDINCPLVSVTNFYQRKLSVAYAGKTQINGVVTTLTSEGSYNEISGAIAKNKVN